jgi:predicted RNA methylase
MPDHTKVYKKQTELYDQMVSKQPSLLKVIEEITPINQSDVIDMGAGSGRITKTRTIIHRLLTIEKYQQKTEVLT